MRRLPTRDQRREVGFRWTLFVFGAALLILGIWVGIFLGDREKPSHRDNSVPQVFSVATMEVARLFSCPCGSCGEKILTVCECPTATSTKRFIETQLNNGYNHEQVVELVIQVYGHYRG